MVLTTPPGIGRAELCASRQDDLGELQVRRYRSSLPLSRGGKPSDEQPAANGGTAWRGTAA